MMGEVNFIIFLVKYSKKYVTYKNFKAVETFQREKKNSQNDEKTRLRTPRSEL